MGPWAFGVKILSSVLFQSANRLYSIEVYLYRGTRVYNQRREENEWGDTKGE
jgi:hypothetical protein